MFRVEVTVLDLSDNPAPPDRWVRDVVQVEAPDEASAIRAARRSFYERGYTDKSLLARVLTGSAARS